MKEPSGIAKARQVLADWVYRQQCPNVTGSRHCCVTTCPECGRAVGPTMTGGPKNEPLDRKCSLVEPWYPSEKDKSYP